MSTPRPEYSPYENLDRYDRGGRSGFIPGFVAVLAYLSLALGVLGVLVVGPVALAAGVVAFALLFSLSAIVRSLRSIEAYTIYMTRLKEYELDRDSTPQ